MNVYVNVTSLQTAIKDDLEIRGGSFRRIMSHIADAPKIVIQTGAPVIKTADVMSTDEDGIVSGNTVEFACPFCGGDVGNFCKECGARMITEVQE